MTVNFNMLYEEKENGEHVLVKSIESVSRVYLRFTNRTSRPVNVSWRDFEGIRRHYKCLQPGSFYDIDTYLTHPWQFTDEATGESYVVNNNPIFRAPANLGGMVYRTNWNVTVRVRTLRQTALLCLASIIRSPDQAAELELPRPLQNELVMLIWKLNNIQPLHIVP